MMSRIPDVAFEAAVLRSALLVGLADENVVARWADDWLARCEPESTLLSDLATTRRELTALREALRPLARNADEHSLAVALLQWTRVAMVAGLYPAPDLLRILEDLRREALLLPELATAVKELEDRANLARVEVAGVTAPTMHDIASVLCGLPPPYFVVAFASLIERAAFVGALSRQFVRERRRAASGQLWLPLVARTDSHCVVLDAEAWQLAQREFHPLPPSASIPYSLDERELRLVLDADTTEVLGVAAATALLHGS